jgi:hypothetical protein
MQKRAKPIILLGDDFLVLEYIVILPQKKVFLCDRKNDKVGNEM